MNDYRSALQDFLTRILNLSINIECADPDYSKDALNSRAHFHHCPELRFILPRNPKGSEFVRAILFPSFVRHNPIDGEELSRCISFWLEPEIVNCNYQGTPQAITISSNHLEHQAVALTAINNWVEHYSSIQQIYGEKLFKLHLNNLLRCVCSSIALVLSDSVLDTHSTPAEQVQRLIRLHYSDPDLSVALIAEKLRMSANYLSEVYKRSTGKTIRASLIEFRMAHAAAMLRTGRYLIKDIAYMCGFRNQYYFSNAFQKQFGAAPSLFTQKIPQDIPAGLGEDAPTKPGAF